MHINHRQTLKIEDVVKLPDFPFQLDIVQKGTIRFAEIENIEERFTPGFDRVVYVPHLIHCGDLIIRDGLFVNTPDLMQWFDECNRFSADAAEMVVRLLDEEGRDYYVWRFYNARPCRVILDETTLKESVVKVKYISFTNDGHIREK